MKFSKHLTIQYFDIHRVSYDVIYKLKEHVYLIVSFLNRKCPTNITPSFCTSRYETPCIIRIFFFEVNKEFLKNTCKYFSIHTLSLYIIIIKTLDM